MTVELKTEEVIGDFDSNDVRRTLVASDDWREFKRELKYRK